MRQTDHFYSQGKISLSKINMCQIYPDIWHLDKNASTCSFLNLKWLRRNNTVTEVKLQITQFQPWLECGPLKGKNYQKKDYLSKNIFWNIKVTLFSKYHSSTIGSIQIGRMLSQNLQVREFWKNFTYDPLKS